MKWYKRFPGDYAAKTAHLSLQERGAYDALLDHYYAHEKPLPAEITRLCRIAGAIDAEEIEAVRRVAEEFFPPNGDGRRHNKRADEEIKKATEKAKGESAWREKSAAAGKRSARLRAARKKGTHTEAEWAVMLAVVGAECPRCGDMCARPHKDHVKPIYQGGSDAIDNLQPLCPPCNLAKGPESTDHIAHLRAEIMNRIENGG